MARLNALELQSTQLNSHSVNPKSDLQSRGDTSSVKSGMALSRQKSLTSRMKSPPKHRKVSESFSPNDNIVVNDVRILQHQPTRKQTNGYLDFEKDGF